MELESKIDQGKLLLGAWAEQYHLQQIELAELYKVAQIAIPYIYAYAVENEISGGLIEVAQQLQITTEIGKVWAKDSFDHEEALAGIIELMMNPLFLIDQTFKRVKELVDVGDEAVLAIISDGFLEVLDIYEKRYRAANGGRASDLFERRKAQSVTPVIGGDREHSMPFHPQLNQPQFPLPPVQSGSAVAVSGLKEKIELLKNPPRDLMYSMQRQHALSRQSM